jgi:hypothetical protein
MLLLIHTPTSVLLLVVTALCSLSGVLLLLKISRLWGWVSLLLLLISTLMLVVINSLTLPCVAAMMRSLL